MRLYTEEGRAVDTEVLSNHTVFKLHGRYNFSIGRVVSHEEVTKGKCDVLQKTLETLESESLETEGIYEKELLKKEVENGHQ